MLSTITAVVTVGLICILVTNATAWSCQNASKFEVGVATVFSSAVLKVIPAKEAATTTISGVQSGRIFRVLKAYTTRSTFKHYSIPYATNESDSSCFLPQRPYIIFHNVSSVSGLVNQTPNPLILVWSKSMERIVRQQMCAKSCRKPNVTSDQTKTVVSVVEGDKAQLVCRTSGKPKPIILWTKSHSKILDSPRWSFVSKRQQSKFVIENVTVSDTGTYRCKAYNRAGESAHQRVRLIVTPRIPVTLTSRIPVIPTPSIDNNKTNLSHVRCPFNSDTYVVQNYCLNGGIYCQSKTLGKRFCVCLPGFTGDRCERKVDDTFTMSESTGYQRSSNVNSSDVGLVVIIVVIMVLLSLVLVIIIIVLAKRLSRMTAVSRQSLHASGVSQLKNEQSASHIACSEWRYSSAVAATATRDESVELPNLEMDGTPPDQQGTRLVRTHAATVEMPPSPHNSFVQSAGDGSDPEMQLADNAACSTLSHNSRQSSVSDVEANCASDADILDVDDERLVSTPASCRGADSLFGGDTTSWTQDEGDSVASSGNELMRQLEAYALGADPSLDQFAVGPIPSLTNFIGSTSDTGHTRGENSEL